MTFRENVLAVLRYVAYDKMPEVSFGYWHETVAKWADEGHIKKEEADGYIKNGDNSESDKAIMKKLGFDFNWNSCVVGNVALFPVLKRNCWKKKRMDIRKFVMKMGLLYL